MGLFGGANIMFAEIPFEIDYTPYIEAITLALVVGVLLGVFLSLMNMAGNRE
jgi:ABC-type antimicrobial peptide transport system permease subunit